VEGQRAVHAKNLTQPDGESGGRVAARAIGGGVSADRGCNTRPQWACLSYCIIVSQVVKRFKRFLSFMRGILRPGVFLDLTAALSEKR